MAPNKSILIINPNSTTSMTEALKPLVNALGFSNTTYTYFTSPTGPASINNDKDVLESSTHCLRALHSSKLLDEHDAFLVACYSKHNLVSALRAESAIRNTGKPVLGIFEASVTTSLNLLDDGGKFGIVSTGVVWEKSLSEAVYGFLGTSHDTASSRFAGVETTGLNATELHEVGREVVEKKMKEATRRLLKRGMVGAVCLGCAGMSGMEAWVREAAVEELGEVEGGRVRVVDGVRAGVGILEGLVRGV